MSRTLVDVRELDGRPDAQLAVVGLLGAGEHAEQRRLARAVRADDADDAGRRQRERQVVDQQVVAVALREVLGLDHHVAEPLAGGDGDLEPVASAVGRLGFGEQLLVRREAGLALGLARLRRHAHPLELAFERALSRRVGLLLATQALLLLFEPRRVVALERDALAAIELEDPARDVVEEVAVVRDGDDGAGILRQRPLEPRHRFGVEVVRRLVEQQQVGLRQQQPAQRDSAALAAGQRGHVRVAGRKPQRVHRDLDRALEVVGALGRDLRLEPGLLLADLLVVGVGIRVLRQHLVVTGEQRGDLADAVHDVALDVLARIELRLLFEQPDGEPGREPGLARVPVVEARHDAQQRRLARAVRPDHTDLGPGVEGERDVPQHLLVRRMEPADLVHGEDELRGGHHAVTLTAAHWPPWRAGLRRTSSSGRTSTTMRARPRRRPRRSISSAR